MTSNTVIDENDQLQQQLFTKKEQIPPATTNTTTTTTTTVAITVDSANTTSSTSSSSNTILTINPTTVTTIYNLPSEILYIIFELLDEVDLCRLSTICHQFNKIASTNELWIALFKKRSFNRSPPLFKTDEKVNFKWVMKEKRSARDNWRNGKYEMTTLIGHSEPISSILFNGESVISSSYDKSLRVWDYATSECKLVIPTNDVECMQLDHTNKNVITGTKNGHINLWDITSGQQLFSEKGHLCFISSLKGNHNSTLFASGAKDKTIKLWDVVQKKMVSSIGFPKNALLNIEWCDDQKNHIVVSGGNILKLIDVETGQTIRNFEGHQNDIHCFSIVDGLIASSGVDATIKVWDKRDEIGAKSIKVDATVYCLKFQPSHNIIITESNDHSVSSYRLDTGRLENQFIGHQNSISVLHLDKERIISGSLDKNLYVWNCNTDISSGPIKLGKAHKLDAHQGMIRCAYFDDTKIISGSYDKTVRIWDFAGAKNNTKRTCSLM